LTTAALDVDDETGEHLYNITYERSARDLSQPHEDVRVYRIRKDSIQYGVQVSFRDDGTSGRCS
jgi:hypothetical protein